MKTRFLLIALLAATTGTLAEVRPATYDLAAIRDASTLETRLVQDWQPASREPSIRQKLIEITVCEWWTGQKVRLPVTLNAPASGAPCRNVIIGSRIGCDVTDPKRSGRS